MRLWEGGRVEWEGGGKGGWGWGGTVSASLRFQMMDDG